MLNANFAGLNDDGRLRCSLLSDTSLEQLQLVDRSALTSVQAFLLDEQLKAKTYANATPAAFQLDEAGELLVLLTAKADGCDFFCRQMVGPDQFGLLLVVGLLLGCLVF